MGVVGSLGEGNSGTPPKPGRSARILWFAVFYDNFLTLPRAKLLIVPPLWYHLLC